MIKNFISFVNEMAKIDKKLNKLSIDGSPLKKTPLELVEPNIVISRLEESKFPYCEGYTMVWFVNDDKNAHLLNDKKNQLHFNKESGLGNNSVLEDIWVNNTEEQKNIIGCIQATTDDNEIVIYLMSVRPGYKRNGINKLMIQSLIKKFPNAKLIFDGPTPKGYSFIKRHFPNAGMI